MECPNCGEHAPDDAKWCEACGQDLNAEPLPACVVCGEREVGEEGYCLSCGHKQPEERDHQEFEAGPVVAVTDRGKRHRHNEDAVAIGMSDTGAAVLVVCDGVSSTPGSAEASLRAAAAARDLLVAGLGTEPGDESPQLGDLLTRAAEAAQTEAAATTLADDDEVSAKAPNSDGGPPSSTFVAAVARPVADGAESAVGSPSDGTELAVAWVGDSRAYWVGDEPTRLTGDDHEIAGSLVRWLGADTLDPTPDIALTTVTGTGYLVVCSDGLWRYAQEPGELAEAVQRLVDDGNRGMSLASGLVDFANAGGGHDNISVALWTNEVAPDWPAPSTAPATDPAPAEGPEPAEGSESENH